MSGNDIKANRDSARRHRTRLASRGSNLGGTVVPGVSGDNSTGAGNANKTSEKMNAMVRRYAKVLVRSSAQVTGLAEKIFARDQEGANKFGLD